MYYTYVRSVSDYNVDLEHLNILNRALHCQGPTMRGFIDGRALTRGAHLAKGSQFDRDEKPVLLESPNDRTDTELYLAFPITQGATPCGALFQKVLSKSSTARLSKKLCLAVFQQAIIKEKNSML